MTTIRAGAKLASLVEKLTDAEKIITPRYTTWMNQYGDDPVYAEEIAEWVKHELRSTKPWRGGRFGPSAGGTCERAQIYGYLAVPTSSRTDPGLLAIYNNGTWAHLRMQATLLQAGILTDTEVDTATIAPSPNPHVLLRGTIDGMGTVPADHPNVGWRGKTFGLEFKTANTFLVKHMKTLADPGEKYYAQVARYFLATTLDMFVILIEDKNTQELLEIVIERPHHYDPNNAMSEMIDQQHYEVLNLQAHVMQGSLPSRLAPCQRGKGEVFHDCPFGGTTANVCHRVDDYSVAEHMSVAATQQAAQKPSKKIKIARRT